MSTKPTDVWTDRSRRASWRCPTCRRWVRCEMARRCTRCAKGTPEAAPEPVAVTDVDPYAPTWTTAPEPEPTAPAVDPYAPTWTIVPEESAAA